MFYSKRVTVTLRDRSVRRVTRTTVTGDICVYICVQFLQIAVSQRERSYVFIYNTYSMYYIKKHSMWFSPT